MADASRVSMHIDLCHLPARHALVIHTNCPATSVSATMRKLFADVAMWAAGHGVRLSGPAVARYDEKADGRCVLDAGYFVDRPIAVDDADVETLDIDDCVAVHASHVGSSESLAATYWALETWAQSHGYAPAGLGWEEHAPLGTPPEHAHADVFLPVRPAA